VTVTVLVLSVDEAEDLRTCLPAVVGQPDADVVVVDNACTDSTVEVAQECGARVLRLARRQSYAAALNSAIAATGGELVLLLNADCTVEPGFVPALRDALRADPGLGSVCPKLLRPDGRAIDAVAAADLPAHVPLLAEALAACSPLGVNVEIKSSPDEPGFDADRSLAEPVLATIAAWGGAVLVSSFDPAMVDRVRALDPGVPTAQLTFLHDRPAADTAAWIAARGHGWWHPFHQVVDEVLVAAAGEAGLRVNAWTVDDPARMAELAAFGVAGIVTNDVEAARRTLR